MWKRLLSVVASIAILIMAGIFGMIGKEFGKAIFSPSKPNPQEIEEKLIEEFTKAANQYNQRLPMMVDQDTRLDKTTVGPGPRAVYHYSFPKYMSKDIDTNWLQNNLRPEVVRKVCGSTNMKKALQYGGIYVYAYSGNDGIEITRFEINRNDCGLSKITF